MKAKVMTDCTNCERPIKHKKCGAKKYVYFCTNRCVREAYRNCCNTENTDRKLVILYLGQHNCISMDKIETNKTTQRFKAVKTNADIMENLNKVIEKTNENFSVVCVERIPNDIDKNVYYVMENNQNKNLKEIIRDGRKWQTFTQTSSQVFSNVLGGNISKNIRKYKCSSQFFCFYEECPFKKRFDLVNQVDYKLENGVRKCFSCGETMEAIKCPAEKIVAMSENNKFVLVKHIGKHKCLAKTIIESQILEEIEIFFEKNPTASRSEAVVHHLANKINFGSAQDVIDLVSVSLNIWEINNAKQRGIRRLNPHVNKLDEIRYFKSKLEDIGNPYSIILKFFDDIYICDT